MARTLLASALLLTVLAMPSEAFAEPANAFHLLPGTVLIVEVDSDISHLLAPDGTSYTFKSGSGLEKNISYLGLYYYAGTPLREWTVKKMVIQGGSISDFGVTRRFFRLNTDFNGDGVSEESRYGIHALGNDKWLEKDKRKVSYGCVVVSEANLNLIQRVFETNGGTLSVLTTYGPQKFMDEQAKRIVQNAVSFDTLAAPKGVR